MKAVTKKIDLKNLDKSNWRKVKFSDIATNVRKASKNPLKDGFTKAIGLEHIEPDNLNLLGYTDIAQEGTKFNKIFRKGQFLFGARRAYLRQMARATFDGVCTANIMVFDIKDENLINRDLFEFIVRSDSFINCAINTSEGSLFPNAKWKYIAEYEFLLPPKDQQAQLAKLLWAMDEVIEKEVEVLNKTKTIQQVKTKEFFSGTFLNLPMKVTKIGKIPEEWKLEKLPEISWFQEGPGLRNWQFQGSGIKIINITNLKEGHLDLNKTERHLSWGEFNETYKHFECKAGDIVVASSGNSYCKHAIIREQDLPLMMNTSVIRFQPINGTNYEYLNQFLKSPLFKFQIDRLITGAAQPNFGPFHLKKILVPIPNNYKIQENIGKTLKSVDKKIIEIKLKLEVSRSLQKSLINHIF